MRSANCSGDTTVIARGLQILTPAYASLEMWNGEAADPRDDIYAYGCITYELLTGRHPFDGASAPVALQNKDKPKRPEQLDRRQWRALRTALALHRADRTPTVARFLRDFAPRSWFQKYAAPLIAAPALVLLGAVALGYWRMSLESVDLDEPAPAHVKLSAEEQSAVNDLVARARDRFSDVDITVNPEQLSYVLSDGLDSVSELIGDALRTQPDNREARELRSQVAALYAAKARELLEQHRPPQTAFKLIEKGLEIKPIDSGLRKLRRDLCERDTAVCLNGRA
jgi:serine/threonine protein kinase